MNLRRPSSVGDGEKRGTSPPGESEQILDQTAKTRLWSRAHGRSELAESERRLMMDGGPAHLPLAITPAPSQRSPLKSHPRYQSPAPTLHHLLPSASSSFSIHLRPSLAPVPKTKRIQTPSICLLFLFLYTPPHPPTPFPLS